MKPLFLCITLILCSFSSYAQSYNATLYSEGVALIPAFSKESPSTIISYEGNLTPRLQYAPDIAIDLGNGELWFLDLWAKFFQPLDQECKWSLTFGANYSFFFQEYGSNGSAISQSVKYAVGEIKLRHKWNDESRVYLDYWYNHVINREYGIRGHYLSLVYEWEKEISPTFDFETKANAFYVNFDDGTEGPAFAIEGSIKHKKSGLFAGVHFLQPLGLHTKEEREELKLAAFVGITREFL